MIVALLLFMAAVQDTDRATPEKTLDAFARAMADFLPEGEKLAAFRWKLDEIGDDLCHPNEKLRRVDNRTDRQKESPRHKMLGYSFTGIRRSEEKAGTMQIEAILELRMEILDPTTEQKKIETLREPKRFSFVKTGDRWLIRSFLEGCRRCSGKGVCIACEGSGRAENAVCRACIGQKWCDLCKGKKVRDTTAPQFWFGLVSEKRVEFAPNLDSPEETAQTYADFVTNKAVEESRAEIEIFRRFLARYRTCLAPDVAKSIDDAFAKAIAEGIDRLKNQRPKVESLEKQEKTATAIVREVVPPELENLNIKDHVHRIGMRKVRDRWLIDNDWRPCACLGKDAKCSFCQGKGWSFRF